MALAEMQGRMEGICLIVEDSVFDQRMLVRSMKKSGKEIPLLVAATLSSARAALQRHGVKLLILDNALPDGLGVDFAVEVSQVDRFRRLPIVLITDWPSPFMFEKAKRAGVRAVLGKSDVDSAALSEFA